MTQPPSGGAGLNRPTASVTPLATPSEWFIEARPLPEPVGPAVIAQIFHATGQTVIMLNPDFAIHIGGLFVTHGRQAKSGIVVPPPGVSMPFPPPNGHRGG
jgi:hypothetical protein